MNTITDLLHKSRLYPVLMLDSLISSDRRGRLIHFCRFAIVFLGLIFAFYLSQDYLPTFLTDYLGLIMLLKNKVLGLMLISLSIFMVAILIEVYFSSFYYLELVAKNLYRSDDIFTMTVGRILYGAKTDDLLVAFLHSDIGGQIIRRLGIGRPEADLFLATNPSPVSAMLLAPTDGPVIKLKDLTKYIFDQSQAFREFLLSHSAKETEFIGAAQWVVLGIELQIWESRWWELDNLTRVPSLARDWSYGGTYNLDLYGRDLLVDRETNSLEANTTTRESEIRQLEAVLSRGREANALLIGEAGPDKMDIIYHLAHQIKEGQTIPALAGKRPVLLEVSLLMAACKEKNSFEQTILKIFSEASQAGNILLVIDDLANLVASADRFGSNIISLMDSYLSGNSIQVIALCDTDNFHRFIESRSSLMTRFEKVSLASLSQKDITEMLLRAIWEVENNFKLFFTYQAVNEIAQGASYYFPDSVGSDKAIDLLTEIAPWARRAGFLIIDSKEVRSFIQNKTNIPIGEVTAKEKDKLLNLESILGLRVIGQREAVAAVASAVRRSRAGVRNPNKPIGTFLFLGPTGVGKTETAKALAATFFDNENELYRLDMSEYQGPDAVDKLIGSFSSGATGVLSTMVRDHPYGVILLDEFEKTSPAVLNIFLPIFDEGFFSDMNGKRVGVKNIIFIATSNAGADLIWEMVEKNPNQELSRSVLIDAIVERGIYKPELLNRFDATVIFRPLGEIELAKIAELQLKKLAKRLTEKGFTLEITPDLTASVAKNGADKFFGARPMLRYIQDQVEQKVADKIIAGEIVAGSKISFVASSLSPADLEIKVKNL
ncbi:MAG: AAA family ATPase [Candidatus Paceibacterota bacterium]|jgi:ATP-dependent Clp protease ATP-binding subunit ClpC